MSRTTRFRRRPLRAVVLAVSVLAVRGHDVVRDSTLPSVAITQPASGAVLGGSSVDLVGTASDPHLDTVTPTGVARRLPAAPSSRSACR